MKCEIARFETRMRDDESLYSYLTKLFDLMRQMKSYLRRELCKNW